MATITGWDGREYTVSAEEASIVAQNKNLHAEYAEKSNRAFDASNQYLARLYADKAMVHEDIINEIIGHYD